jgi:hypothetical protein
VWREACSYARRRRDAARVRLHDGRVSAPGGKSRGLLRRAFGARALELLAGLRKLGHERPEDVKLAVLEETGHISAVARDTG